MGLLDIDNPSKGKKRGLLDGLGFSQASTGESGATDPDSTSGSTGGNTDPTPAKGGFLGKGWDDPKTLANLKLAAGLMGPGGFGVGLSRGLSGYEETMGQAADRTSREKERTSIQGAREQGMQFQQLQMQDMQRQAGQQIAMQKLAERYSLAPPTDGVGPQGFDFGGYSDALAAVDPVKALAIKAAIQKDSNPIKLSAGEKLLAPGTFQELANNPKVAEDPAAIKEYHYAQMQGYKGTFQQYQTDMRKAGASRVDVRYGAPVAGVGPDGKPAFFQPDPHGGAPKVVQGFSPTPPVVPASTKEKMAENAVALGKIDQALGLVSTRPDSLGLQNNLGDTVMQRLDPKGVEVRAAVADIGSQKIHDRSGAAVTISEAPRLKPFVPQATDTPQAVVTKLKRLQSEYRSMQQALQSGASINAAAAAQPASSGGWSIKRVP